MSTLEAGALVPDVPLLSADGSARLLSEILQDGPALLAIYKTTCPTCQLALPYLARLAGGNFQLLPVSQDDPERTAEFSSYFGLPLESLFDSEDAGYPLSNALGVTHVPSLFLVNPGLRIAWSWVGFHRARYEELAALAGQRIFQPGDEVPESKYG